MTRLLSTGYLLLAAMLVLEVVLITAHLYLGNDGFVLALTVAMCWTLAQIIFVKTLHLKNRMTKQ